MYEYKEIYSINFTDINNYYDMHTIIKEAFDFPDYYGCNFDALWDCLTDMVGRPIHIEIIGLEEIERKYKDTAQKLCNIFKEFKHYNNDKYVNQIVIEIVNGKNRLSLL